ncbi:16S rRNA (cytosine(967)-C(5))-methyltransferase RsmB [Proteiniclasticum sp.]|uniref:16S rRNA (cytosine(967)-C(5))-methyltransferase RsmB n=1 Tax=Proteiniclasticum sp. TaxID=2053595 RepID=UPI00289931D9|nr:16S rRNA (cytosine(967)-C(5))-methyltransferase RsmB [Proteiniclasticum sp.]
MMNVRETAVEILGKVLYQGAFSNLLLDRAIQSGQVKEEDVGLLTEIVYGTLKYLLTIDEILKRNTKISLSKTERYVLDVLRISVYQMHFLDRIPPYAVINEAVNLTKKKAPKASGFVNGVLRGYLRKKDELYTFNKKIDEEIYEYSFPAWMIQLFKNQYGDKYLEILSGLNERPVITYRVNTLKMSRDAALEELRQLGYSAEKTAISPYGIEVTGGKSVMQNPLFREGVLTVQDESSMLVAPLVVSEGEEYLDLCSAPGGKTMHLAELLHDQVPVHAFDIYESKLRLIRENRDRLGLTSVTIRKNNGLHLLPEYVGKAHVLLDAPCSGLGIIRKKPEIKYTKTPEELLDLVKIQRDLLETAMNYIPPGGTLVYSTCTLNQAENEENVRWFLERHNDFETVPINVGEGDHLQYSPEGFLTILPGKTMDGFFISKLKRMS